MKDELRQLIKGDVPHVDRCEFLVSRIIDIIDEKTEQAREEGYEDGYRDGMEKAAANAH